MAGTNLKSISELCEVSVDFGAQNTMPTQAVPTSRHAQRHVDRDEAAQPHRGRISPRGNCSVPRVGGLQEMGSSALFAKRPIFPLVLIARCGNPGKLGRIGRTKSTRCNILLFPCDRPAPAALQAARRRIPSKWAVLERRVAWFAALTGELRLAGISRSSTRPCRGIEA
jgi:hypothetical protein